MNANGGSGMDEGDKASGEASLLEARYRRALTPLPARYREQRGEEMVSTLLDGATDARRWPSVAELASIVALATRLRVGAPGGTRRAVAAGEVLRRTALVGLLAMGLWYAVPAISDAVSVFTREGYYARYEMRSIWAWRLSLEFVQPLLYLGAFTALLLGRRRLGRFLGVAQVTTAVVEVVQAPYTLRSSGAALLAVAAVIAVAAGVGFHSAAAPFPTRRRWLVIAAGIIGVALAIPAAFTAIAFDASSVPWEFTLSARLETGPLLPAVAAVFGLLRARRSPIWPAALLLLGLPGLLLAPRALIAYSQGKAVDPFLGDLFDNPPWLGMASYMAITDTILAIALAWALYRRRVRSNAVAA